MKSSILPKLVILGGIAAIIMLRLAGPLGMAAQNAAMQQQAQQSNAWMQQQLEAQQQQMMLEMQQLNGLVQQGPGGYYAPQGYPDMNQPGAYPMQPGAYPDPAMGPGGAYPQMQLQPGMDGAMYPQPAYPTPDPEYYYRDNN